MRRHGVDKRKGVLRRLSLIDPRGRVFLERRGFDLRLFGVYLHRIDLPDPGLDLHDHPWPFVSLILRGGYAEEWAPARDLAEIRVWQEREAAGVVQRRHWRPGSIHRMPLTVAHRITDVPARTWTLVLRGRKSRRWGFYLPGGWVDQEDYDYAARRPLTELRVVK